MKYLANFEKNKTDTDFFDWSVKCRSQKESDMAVSSMLRKLHVLFGADVKAKEYDTWICDSASNVYKYFRYQLASYDYEKEYSKNLYKYFTGKLARYDDEKEEEEDNGFAIQKSEYLEAKKEEKELEEIKSLLDVCDLQISATTPELLQWLAKCPWVAALIDDDLDCNGGRGHDSFVRILASIHEDCLKRIWAKVKDYTMANLD